MSHTQQDLFSSIDSSPALDRSFSMARRVDLDTCSWVDVVPRWLQKPDELLKRLQVSVSWTQRDRRLFDQVVREPRLTAEFRTLDELSDPMLIECVDALSRHYGIPYDGLWLNHYRNGEDSTAWHRDRFSCRRPDCIVPVMTLGATRRFLIKPRDGGPSTVFKPGSGDLIVMGGRAQQDWVHSVPKDHSVAEGRISINFQSSLQACAS